MQTAQIKVGEVYAHKRDNKLVRVHVYAIITRKAADATKSVIEGYIVEDRKEGQVARMMKFEPDELLGPYAAQAELAKRAEQEAIDKKAAEIAQDKQAQQDRLALYAFVGETPPKDTKEYRQLFRVSFGSVDFSNDGTRRLIEAVRASRSVKTPVG